tara:strand:- start:8086 stop:8817 length:732 start_codon:yes stop_codon:yes gene_type:complete
LAGFDHLIATRYFRYSIILIVAFVAGCASIVTVEGPSIPRPHFDKLPLIVALRLPAEFQDFVHEENVLGREPWTIKLGSSNAKFFTQLFGYMFDNVIVLGPDDDVLGYTFDALVEPTIEGFEFSVPNQSKTDAFVVWIRYRMQVFDSVGTSASTWTVSAYGKSQTEGLSGEEALQRAAVLAMRDAAALILLQMDKATNIGVLADGPIDTGKPDSSEASDGNLVRDEPTVFDIFTIGGIDEVTN